MDAPERGGSAAGLQGGTSTAHRQRFLGMQQFTTVMLLLAGVHAPGVLATLRLPLRMPVKPDLEAIEALAD